MQENRSFNSWEEIKEYLAEDEDNCVGYHVWTFYANSMNCTDGCCWGEFESIEECIETISDYCSGDYTKVKKS